MSELHIETKQEGAKTVLFLSGDLDTLTSTQLSDVLMPEMEAGATVCLDMESLVYISSAGLRVMLNALKTAKNTGAALTLRGLSAENEAIMQATGFVKYFTIES